jgi:hypothetical protein
MGAEASVGYSARRARHSLSEYGLVGPLLELSAGRLEGVPAASDRKQRRRAAMLPKMPRRAAKAEFASANGAASSSQPRGV